MQVVDPPPPPRHQAYVGFWARVWATLIDTALVLAVTVPLLAATYGWSYFDPQTLGSAPGVADIVISYVAPAVAAVAFWLVGQATPGKMAISARVVDASTGNTLTLRQSVVRYLSYFVSALPLGAGFLWVAFDAKKQGWHDKLAGSLVVRAKDRR